MGEYIQSYAITIQGEGEMCDNRQCLMSNIMTQIDWFELGVNMVGTTQVNWTRVDAKVSITKIKEKIGTY